MAVSSRKVSCSLSNVDARVIMPKSAKRVYWFAVANGIEQNIYASVCIFPHLGLNSCQLPALP